MAKYSVCIDALFGGRDLPAAIREIAALGYSAYEFWNWRDKDIDAIEAAQREAGLVPVAFCTVLTSLVDPASRSVFMDGLQQSIDVAHRLGAKSLIATVGNELPDVPRQCQRQSIVDALRGCVPTLQGAGITLVIEPLNLTNHRGYFLPSSDEAFDIVREVGHPRVKLLFDIYHQQISEGDIIRRMTENIGLIGHVHAAGVPGRHELDTGELNYPAIFGALDRAGYDGYIGLEYFPERPVECGLGALIGSL